MFFLFLFLLGEGSAMRAYSQNRKIDSILVLLKTAKQDTNYVKTLDELSAAFISIDPKKSLEYATRQLKLAQKLQWKKGLGNAYHNIGYADHMLGNLPAALESWLKGLKAREECGDIKGVAGSLGNIGIIYRMQGDYKTALSYYFRSLKMQEDLGNIKKITSILGNIGSVYYNQGSATSDTSRKNDNYRKALFYYFKALKMAEEQNNKITINLNLGNIGSLYKDMGEYQKALDFCFRSEKITEDLGDKNGMARNFANIGSTYLADNKLKNADMYLHKAFDISKEIGYAEGVEEIELNFSELYGKLGQWKISMEHYKKYIAAKDSLFNEDNTKKTVRSEMNYEFDKKEAVTKAENEKRAAVAAAENRKQKIFLLLIAAVAVAVAVIAFIIFRSLRVTRKQKHIIELQKAEVFRQKELVEEHQKEIIDSITYAKRLQEAILPPLDLVKKHLPESFVLYKPKDIVAGDFYWMEVLNDTIFIAAADCTGHGVPGAMVSVVCSNALNRTVKEFGLRDTGKILDKVTELVLETFEKSDADVKDGMDISLLSINKTSGKITWSGANNPLWYIHRGDLVNINADKQPIGKHDNPVPFTTHTITPQENTTFYLFTDGFADQFGGPKGKKFKYKQFEEKLMEFSSRSVEEQKNTLEKIFDEWKSWPSPSGVIRSLEQVDDVLVIGIKV